MRLQWWFISFFPSFLSKSVSSCFSYCHGNTAKYTEKCNKPTACKKVCTKRELLTKQGALLIHGFCRDISGGEESLFITCHYRAKWKYKQGDKIYQDFQNSYQKGYQHQVGPETWKCGVSFRPYGSPAASNENIGDLALLQKEPCPGPGRGGVLLA